MRETSQPARPEPPAAWSTSGQDAQVFVDHSGRRARGVRVVGVAAAGVCAFWLAGLTVGMAGFSGFPTVGLRVLSHTALAQQLALRADAGVDRSAVGLTTTAAGRSRGRLADADSSARLPSCLAPRTVLPSAHGPAGLRRSPAGRAVPPSSKQGLTASDPRDCVTVVAAASRRGPNSRLT